SEFGLDSQRNGPEKQAEVLGWAIRAAAEEGAAGMTVYAWSDRWWNAAMEILDWDFGLERRDGTAKPALAAVTQAFAAGTPHRQTQDFAVIVCTRNGAPRIAACLTAILNQNLPAAEVIVVDDGSTDETSLIVAKYFPTVKLLTLPPGGLSAARNAGAEAATSPILAFTDDDCEPDPDWLLGLSRAFQDGWDAAGGPNLPPPPHDSAAAVVAAAPGAPSHVMLSDAEAEHLPGCNLAVRRTAYFDIGGFDPVFRTAGDDVDFCWRLKDHGCRLGFAPTAFVWHHRRPSLRGYLKQQLGYGRAEALLIAKHPHRFTDRGDAKWEGFVYSGGPVRAVEGSIIYHGRMGLAGYQGVVDRMQPLRPLDPAYDNCLTRTQLALLTWLQPRLRAWKRCHRWISGDATASPVSHEPQPDASFTIWSENGAGREDYLERLLSLGWKPGGESEPWDVEKDGTRVLIATEKGDGPGRNNLFRVWGDPALLSFLQN
ncbi:MAG: hypothetical protein JWO82_1176, partial [Akkermansiaceae bacterium]|nr:hypothetical protein [Akkermansiaceae bacterium]